MGKFFPQVAGIVDGVVQFDHAVEGILRFLLALEDVDQQRRDGDGGDRRQHDHGHEERAASGARRDQLGLVMMAPSTRKRRQSGDADSEWPTELWQRVHCRPSALPCTTLPSMAAVMFSWQRRQASSVTL